jgi:phosphoglycolate phosphatase
MTPLMNDDFAAALFDFDMTLMDTSWSITEYSNKLADKFNLRSVTRDDLLKVIGLPIMESWAVLWGHGEEEWLDYYRGHFRVGEQAGFVEFPDTRSAVESLRANGVKTGVVSNRKFAASAVTQSGIRDLFDTVVGLEDVENPKPHPEPLLKAIARLGVSAENTFYAGDTDIDMKTARAAGVRGIGVTTGAFGADALEAAGAFAVCPDLTGVAETILNTLKKR